MKNRTPKIVYQIWLGINGPFEALKDSWKENHSNWQYEFENNTRMNNLTKKYYPCYLSNYQNFKYKVQHWNVVCYLILYKLGSIYMELVYEYIMFKDYLLKNKECCFSIALEPEINFDTIIKETTIKIKYPIHNPVIIMNRSTICNCVAVTKNQLSVTS